MLYVFATFYPCFSEEEESWGIFIWDKNMRIKMIFPTAQFGSNLTFRYFNSLIFMNPCNFSQHQLFSQRQLRKGTHKHGKKIILNER